jgi:anti-sigma regulatory factor (Ser/Thr protein kinase)
MNGVSELRVFQEAQTRSVAPLRHALFGFCEALRLRGDAVDDIVTAAGEALANAVEHAYENQPTQSQPPTIELHARFDRGDLALDIVDRGKFVVREPLPWRGFGLRIMRAIAQQMTVDTSDGTRVRMHFSDVPIKVNDGQQL